MDLLGPMMQFLTWTKTKGVCHNDGKNIDNQRCLPILVNYDGYDY